MINMETRNWPMVLIGVLLIALIFNFLKTIFSSDVKRFSHDRIYVDYSSYQTKGTVPSKPAATHHHSSYISHQVELSRQTMDSGRLTASVESFNKNMGEVLAQVPVPEDRDKPLPNPQFQEVTNLGNGSVDGLSQAKLFFSEGKFEQALSAFSTILEKIPNLDLIHRYQVCDQIAECYFFLKNNESYVQYKVKYVRFLRQYRGLFHKAYPDRPLGKFDGWMSPEEASQNLLKIRVFAAENLSGDERESTVRRAELDLEVARQAPG